MKILCTIPLNIPCSNIKNTEYRGLSIVPDDLLPWVSKWVNPLSLPSWCCQDEVEG